LRHICLCATIGVTLVGCRPKGIPAYSPDRSFIVLAVRSSRKADGQLWTYSVKDKTATLHPMPRTWKLSSLQWLGSDLWLHCLRDVGVRKDPETGEPVIDKKTGKPVRDIEETFSRYSLENDTLIPGPFDPPNCHVGLMGDVFIGGYRRRPVIFATNPWASKKSGEGIFAYDMYSLDNLKKIGSRGFTKMMSAGYGWVVRTLGVRDNHLTRNLTAVQVVNDRGRETCRIGAEAIAPICHRGGARFPAYARVAPDGSAMLLVFGTETIFRNHPKKYTFGVFSTDTGRMLYCGATDGIDGTPLVGDEESWCIEQVGRKVYLGEKTLGMALTPQPAPASASGCALVCFRIDAESDEKRSIREEVLNYELGDGGFVEDYAPDAKTGMMLVAVSGKRPRLLMIPLRKDANAADIISVELPQVEPRPSRHLAD